MPRPDRAASFPLRYCREVRRNFEAILDWLGLAILLASAGQFTYGHLRESVAWWDSIPLPYGILLAALAPVGMLAFLGLLAAPPRQPPPHRR